MGLSPRPLRFLLATASLVLLVQGEGCNKVWSSNRNQNHPWFWSSSVLQIRGGASARTRSADLRSSVQAPPAKWNTVKVKEQSPKKKVIEKTTDDTDAASTSMMTFNLVKAILGSGILALPAAIATLTASNDLSVLVPATLLIALTGVVSAYGFTLVGLVCDATGARTFKEAWNSCVGKNDGTSVQVSKTSWMPAMACLAVTFCTTLSYTMVLADTIPQLLPFDLSRTTALVGLAVVLTPVCLLQELKKLAPISILGIIGTIYTALAMVFRWYKLPTSRTLDFSRMALKSPAIYMSMLSTSFMAHYNAPKMFWELRGSRPLLNETERRTSLSKFVQVVCYGFVASVAVMGLVATSGFAVFGQASASNILMSYAADDVLMTLSRMAIALSLFCTFPLAFVGIRNQFIELAGLPGDSQPTVRAVTVSLLSVLVVTAFFVRDLGVLLAVGGATWGNAIIFLFPSLMLVHAATKFPHLQAHVPFAVMTGMFGVTLASMGSGRIMSLIRS